ncbi:MAG: type IV pilin [Thermoplasmatota archaeon]
MRRPDASYSGISPVIAILLIVAITIILAGVVSIWVFSFATETNEEGDTYLFKTDLEASDDTIHISLLSGSKFLNTSRMKIKLDDTWISNISIDEIKAGELFIVQCGMDIIAGDVYHVKIVIDNRMMYEGDPVANP